MKKSALLITACVLFLLVMVGCEQGKTQVSTKASDEKQSTQIVIDDLGRKIEIPKNPQRIICFRSDDVGTLFALGAGDKVVGRPSYEAFPEDVLVRMWEDVDLEKEGLASAFDLVFASMTPAVSDDETLLKLNQASRKYCCLISWAGGKFSQTREELWELIFKEKDTGRGHIIIYPASAS